MQPEQAGFVFALCNPHLERVLKGEVAAALPAWRPSYQRKGFVTFKLENGCRWDDLSANLACARRLCLSLGRFKTAAEAFDALDGVTHRHQVVYEDHRLQPRPAEHPATPAVGDEVGTVVSLSDDEHWAGLHRHAPWLSPDPGGDSGVVMPDAAPSRAWLKLEEAARFFGLEFRAGEIAVELGCAPGGVVHALLERGVSVIGVDPAGMAEIVQKREIVDLDQAPANSAWFHHCRKPAALVSRRDLMAADRGPAWFLSDMNQAPDVVLRECERFVKMAPGIRGVLITLKLSDLGEVVGKQHWIEALKAIGFSTVRLQQLAVHHRELALLGLR